MSAKNPSKHYVLCATSEKAYVWGGHRKFKIPSYRGLTPGFF